MNKLAKILMSTILSFAVLLNTTNSISAAGVRYIDPIFTSVDVKKGIVYSQINGTALDLDVYQPQGDTLTSRPVIVFIHGGGFAIGSKEDMFSVCTEFAKKGYVTVSINYRLTDKDYSDKLDPANIKNIVPIMNAQQDSQVAVRWIRANSSVLKIDKDKIFAAGNSAGAVLALLLNFNYEGAPTGRENSVESPRVSAASSYVGTSDPAMISQGDAPVIMFNAGQDKVIIPSWVYPFQSKLVELSVPHEFYWYQDALHGTIPYSEFVNKTTNFFANQLNVFNNIYDLNSDGLVNIVDIGMIISHYGENNPQDTKLDVNKDGVVNIVDIGLLIDNYDF